MNLFITVIGCILGKYLYLNQLQLIYQTISTLRLLHGLVHVYVNLFSVYYNVNIKIIVLNEHKLSFRSIKLAVVADIIKYLLRTLQISSITDNLLKMQI